MISLLAGIAFGPNGANFIRPDDYAECDVLSREDCEADLNAITLNFSRLVLGVQLVLAGVQLPSKYLIREWKSIALLLGPGMTSMWLATSVLVWGFALDDNSAENRIRRRNACSDGQRVKKWRLSC